MSAIDKGNVRFERISTWSPDFVASLRRHYTGSRGAPPGKKMAWRIYEDDHIIGYIGLGEPAFKLAPRRALGLADARPISNTVCCFVYRREASARTKSSAILRAWHDVAALDWLSRYGWTPEHWETLVLPSAIGSAVPGACFRRAGYRSLGCTTGRTARRPKGRAHGDRLGGYGARVWTDAEPKLVLYRGPLVRASRPSRTTP